jgi:hypothetical protein
VSEEGCGEWATKEAKTMITLTIGAITLRALCFPAVRYKPEDTLESLSDFLNDD